MKLTLQQHETTVTIEHEYAHDNIDIDTLIETMIKPLLIAGGWGADLVEETFKK